MKAIRREAAMILIFSLGVAVSQFLGVKLSLVIITLAIVKWFMKWDFKSFDRSDKNNSKGRKYA